MAQNKSLFDAAKPVIFILNLFFGFSIGNEKKMKQPERCFKKMIKIFMKIQYVYIAYEYFRDKHFPFFYGAYSFLILLKGLLVFTNVVVHWFCFDEGTAEEVAQRMKQLPLGKMSREKIKRNFITYKIYVGYFSLILLFIVLLAVIDPVGSIVDNVQFSFFFIFKTTLPVPVLVCFIPCLVSVYCASRVEELAFRLKRARSPLRRSRMMSGMLREYYQLHQVATLTNRLTARAMSFLRMAFVLMTVITVMFHSANTEENIYDSYFVDISLDNFANAHSVVTDLVHIVAGCGIVNFFPLIQYLLVAPPANQMFSVLSKSFAQSFLLNDEWHLRNTVISEDARPHLLRMRLNQLTHLVHVAFDEPPFTLLGEAVADDALFSLFLEVTDLHSNLSVRRGDELMVITRVENYLLRSQTYKKIMELKRFYLRI